MSDLIIRALPEDVHRRLSARAAENGRTPEDEALAALEHRYSSPGRIDPGQAWRTAVDASRDQLRAENGGEMPTGTVDESLDEKRLTAAAIRGDV